MKPMELEKLLGAMLVAGIAASVPVTATGATARSDRAPLDDSRPAHRAGFLAAAVSLATGRMADYEARRRELDDYVLAPYLDYAALRRDMRTLSAGRATQFLDAQGDTQLGVQFRREWLGELARREDWRQFVAFDVGSGDPGPALRCRRLQAKIALDTDATGVRDEMLDLWATGSSLPDACDPPIAHAKAQGWIGPAQVWSRLRLAIDAGNAGIAGFLARQLPEEQRAQGERLARALSDPGASAQSAASWPDRAEHREAAALALRRLARPAVESAITHWHALSARLNFDETQRAAILREIALYAAVDGRADAEDWFERVPAASRDEQLAEWQLRAALRRQDWTAVRDVANGLPAPLVDTPRPRYWRARALEELGDREAARRAYEALASEANFHGFLAADRADVPYSICPIATPPDPAIARALRAKTDMARALELHAIGWRAEAARAWDHELADADEATRLQALLLASEQGWHDRAVFALNSGENLRRYDLRFPVAHRQTVERESALNQLDTAWVYALIRAESAWQPDARSHADAYGLMQLLPGTGQAMARELKLPWGGTGSLFDPETNIRLGTRYLSQQAERFAGSPWLATAAYNAGPAPVQRWLGSRGTLPADVFIETIPYGETREYVTRVLAFSVIYDWRLYGKTRRMSSRLPEPGQRYAGVPSPQSAREVVCAVPSLAAAPMSMRGLVP
jgi:soluble lytic murein transglycosylase